MKYQKIVSAIAIFSTLALSAQEENSEIVISEENLISLIQKIKEKRESQRLTNYSAAKATNLDDRGYWIEKPKNSSDNSKDLNDIKSKLISLEYEMKYLNALLLNNQKGNSKEDLLIINNPAKQKENKNEELEKKIDSLRLLYLKENAQGKNKEDNAELKALNDKYQSLLNKLSTNINKKDTLIIEKRENSDYARLVSLYGNYKKQIFFENNSKSLSDINHSELNNIIKTTNSSEKIDVYLKGFASSKGNPIYNENLSLQRTESIKKYLITKGVHPSRILTQYHGIDYATSNDETARRVDITFIIRK